MKRAFVLILILAAGLFLRIWRLADSDITPDEHHYINDAVRFLRGDPFISIRHHPFLHAKPNMGHPFLTQIAISQIFRLFGTSIFVSRLISVLSGMIIIVLLLSFKKLPIKIRFLAAAVYAIMPLAVRFNRTAYLDSFLSVWTLLIGYSLWRGWPIIAGIATALAISSKLSGPFAVLSLIILSKRKSLARTIIPAAIVSFLLNDPGAYLNGIRQPADLEFQVLQPNYWLQGINLFMSQLYNAGLFLIGPALIWGIIWSLVYFVRHFRGDKTLKFLGMWLLSLTPFMWLQPKSEYAWLPVLPVLSLLMAYVIIKTKLHQAIIFLMFLITLPFTIIYGLKFKKLPFIRQGHTYNRTINDNFYQSILAKANQVTPPNGRVMFLPQHEYPFFALRPDISWSYYGDPNNFEVYVVDHTVPVPASFKLVEVFSGREDDQELIRKIYVK